MYVDDLVTRDNNFEEVREIKQNSVLLFKKGVSFYISGTPMCLNWRVKSDQSVLTYAKQVLN